MIEYPFSEDPKKGLFCIFDGHAGKECAEAVATLFPKYLQMEIEKTKNFEDMSIIFSKTYHSVDEQLTEFECVGCTATTVFVWQVGGKRFILELYLSFNLKKKF